MKLDDMVAFTSELLEMDMPQEAKDEQFLLLFRELLRDNRIHAEKRGIGKASALKLPNPTDDELDRNPMLDRSPLLTWQAFEGLQEEWDKWRNWRV